MTVAIEHIGPPITIAKVRAEDFSTIDWAVSTPGDSTFKVDVSYDEGAWIPATHGETLPNMPIGTQEVRVRKTFTATDGPSLTKSLDDNARFFQIVTAPVTNLLDIRVDLKPDDWKVDSGTQYIVSGTGSFRLYTGGLIAWAWPETGNSSPYTVVNPHTELGLTDGLRAQVRVVMNLATGRADWYKREWLDIADLSSDDNWTVGKLQDSIAHSSQRRAGTKYNEVFSSVGSELEGKWFGAYVRNAETGVVEAHLTAEDIASVEHASVTANGWTCSNSAASLQLDPVLQEWPVLHGLSLRAGQTLQADKLNVDYSYKQVGKGSTRSVRTDIPLTGRISVVGQLPSWLDLDRQVAKPYVEIMVADNKWAKFPLGSFKGLIPDVKDDGTLVRREIRLSDLLYPVAQAQTEDFYTAPAQRNIVLFVREDILADQLGLSGFSFPATSQVLAEDITFAKGKSWLHVANTALQAVAWEPLTVDVDGNYTSKPLEYDKVSEWTYQVDSPVLPKTSLTPESVENANVLVFRPKRSGPSLPEEGNGQTTIKNYSTGPGSILERGYEIRREIGLEAKDQTELELLATSEAERIFAGGGMTLAVEVAMNPLHWHRDVVRIERARLSEPMRDYWVTKWGVSLTTGQSESNHTMKLELEAVIGRDLIRSFGAVGVFSAELAVVVTPSAGQGSGVVTAAGSYAGRLRAAVGVTVGQP